MEPISSVAVQLKACAANNRTILNKYGENAGRQIFRVKEATVDLKAHENARIHRENNILFVSKNIKHFVIEKVDILGVSLGIDANDKPVILINDNIQGLQPIRCSLKEPDFNRKVTSISVREAIEADRTDGNPIYFSNLDALTKEVNALNADSLKDTIDLIKYLENCKNVLVSDAALNNEYLKKYHTECDRDVPDIMATTSVTIKAEVTE